jgi:hypothetical protein
MTDPSPPSFSSPDEPWVVWRCQPNARFGDTLQIEYLVWSRPRQDWTWKVSSREAEEMSETLAQTRARDFGRRDRKHEYGRSVARNCK